MKCKSELLEEGAFVRSLLDEVHTECEEVFSHGDITIGNVIYDKRKGRF